MPPRKRQGGRVSQPAPHATVTPRSTLGVPPGEANGTTPCARRYEVGDGTVERCTKPRGHDDDHALLMELERGALEQACMVPLEGPITADEARVRSANRFLIKREAALVAEVERLRALLPVDGSHMPSIVDLLEDEVARLREALDVIATCPPEAVHLMPLAAQAALCSTSARKDPDAQR